MVVGLAITSLEVAELWTVGEVGANGGGRGCVQQNTEQSRSGYHCEQMMCVFLAGWATA